MKQIPCELIEDLLPVYADKLTNPVTNDIVEEHLKNCQKCAKTYERMKAPQDEEKIAARENKEIDFLKKTRKNMKKTILIWAAVLWMLAIVIFGGIYYFGGSYMNTDYLSYHLDVTGDDLEVSVTTTGSQGIQKVDIYEEQGVVEITVRGAKGSLFYGNSKTKNFTASQKIRQVWIGDRIVWANGEAISPITSNLYAVYNPYVGNMPSNGKIVQTLNMTAYTGSFKNELQTTTQPYAWKMILENDFSSNCKEEFENRLTNYAYILLAEVGNLDEVIFEYTLDGTLTTLSVTSEEATAFAGTDIKGVAEDINRLEQLLRKTGLSNIVLGGAPVDSNAQVDFSFSEHTEKVLGFTVINYAQDDIYGMRISVESKGTEALQALAEADNSAIQKGMNIDFQLLPEDFAKEIPDDSEGTIRLYVTDKAGNEIEVSGEVVADLIWGSKYQLNLSGDAKTGYYLGR